MTIEETIDVAPTDYALYDTSRRGLVRAATIIAAGNVASRVLGLVREATIAYLFGATGQVSAFRVAATLVQQLYDFLVGGVTSAALVPVFSDIAEHSSRNELWRIASIVANVVAIVLALAVLVLEIFSNQVVSVLGGGYSPELQAQASEMIRLVLPAVFFLGLSGIVTGLLYSLKRFTLPAFTAAAFNAGIVLLAVALSWSLGIASLILGIIVGSVLQIVLQLPGLRDAHYEPIIDLHHPALVRILKLYLPVLGGLAIAQIGVALDRYLVSFTGAQSLAWMSDATVLIQFPLGLVATATSFAILPELSRLASQGSDVKPGSRSTSPDPGFQNTLAFGIKLVLILIVPAAMGLWVLAKPVVALLFEHGVFTPDDTLSTATALQFYLIGLPFAAIDQPLVFAFYARKNTLTPNLVAFAGVGIYLAAALALIKPFGMIGLVVANSAQLTGHALIMLWLGQRYLTDWARTGLVGFLFRVLVASCAMGLVSYVSQSLFYLDWQKVLAAGLFGVVAYMFFLKLLRVREAELLIAMVQARAMTWTRRSRVG